MERQRHFFSHEDSTAVRQSLEFAWIHGKKNTPSLETSTIPYRMTRSSCSLYQELQLRTQLEARIRYVYTASSSLGEVIREEPWLIHPHHPGFTDQRLSETNYQLAQNNALLSRYSSELDLKKTAVLLATSHRQLAFRPDHQPTSPQKLPVSGTVMNNTDDYVKTKPPSQRNIGNESKRKTRNQGINDRNNYHGSDRLSDQNSVLKCKKRLELDVASTLCSLSIPKVVNKENKEKNQCIGDSQSEENYPTRLSMPNDESELNSLHCFVRKELLELFFYKKEKILTQNLVGHINNDSHDGEIKKDISVSPNYDLRIHIFKPSSLTENDISDESLRVGFRCVHCAHLHMASSIMSCEGANTDSSASQNTSMRMNAIYPKSVMGIYRLICKWQRVHFKKCKHIPPSVKKMYDHLKSNDKSRGKTRYWVSSAAQLGLIDDTKPRGGIRYDVTKRG